MLPSEIRRLRASRLKLQAPSFSLGFEFDLPAPDLDPVSSGASLDKSTVNSLNLRAGNVRRIPLEEIIENGQGSLSSGEEQAGNFNRWKPAPPTTSSFNIEAANPVSSRLSLRKSSKFRSTREVDTVSQKSLEKAGVEIHGDERGQDLLSSGKELVGEKCIKRGPPPSFSRSHEATDSGSFESSLDEAGVDSNSVHQSRKTMKKITIELDSDNDAKDFFSLDSPQDGQSKRLKRGPQPSSSLGEHADDPASCEASLDTSTEMKINPGAAVDDRKPLENVTVVLDSDEDGHDFLSSGSGQFSGEFKRLKRGPASARKYPLKGPSQSKQRLDSTTAKVVNGSSLEPLPLDQGIRNEVIDDFHVSSNSFGGQLGRTGPSAEEASLASASGHKSKLKLKRGPPSISGEAVKLSQAVSVSGSVPRSNVETKGAASGGFGNHTPSIVDIFRKQFPKEVQEPSTMEVDEIEEFSDNELFGFGSGSQRHCRFEPPQKLGTDPILINSSPEDLKPSRYVPETHLQSSIPEPPLRPSQDRSGEISSDDDTLMLDDFQSGKNCWRTTRPDFNRSNRTSQLFENATSGSQRSDPKFDQSQNSQLNVARDGNVTSFETETPLRRDTVGPSQAFRSANLHEGEETEHDLISAFFRLRFPHYKPVDELLEDGGLDNEPVYIDYRNQFGTYNGSTQPQHGVAGTKWSPVRSIRGAFSDNQASTSTAQRQTGRKKAAPKAQARKKNGRKKGSGEGRWTTLNGARVFLVDGHRLSGRSAYKAYAKTNGFKKKNTKKNTK